MDTVLVEMTIEVKNKNTSLFDVANMDTKRVLRKELSKTLSALTADVMYGDEKIPESPKGLCEELNRQLDSQEVWSATDDLFAENHWTAGCTHPFECDVTNMIAIITYNKFKYKIWFIRED